MERRNGRWADRRTDGWAGLTEGWMVGWREVWTDGWKGWWWGGWPTDGRAGELSNGGMYGWVVGGLSNGRKGWWADRRIDVWAVERGEQTGGWTNGWISEKRTYGQTDGRTGGQTDRRMEGQTDGRTDGWTDLAVSVQQWYWAGTEERAYLPLHVAGLAGGLSSLAAFSACPLNVVTIDRKCSKDQLMAQRHR